MRYDSLAKKLIAEDLKDAKTLFAYSEDHNLCDIYLDVHKNIVLKQLHGTWKKTADYYIDSIYEFVKDMDEFYLKRLTRESIPDDIHDTCELLIEKYGSDIDVIRKAFDILSDHKKELTFRQADFEGERIHIKMYKYILDT